MSLPPRSASAPISASELRIGPLRTADREPAARLLGRAFARNPLNRAVVGGRAAAAERIHAAGMRATLATAERHGHVLVARPPGGEREPLAGVLLAAAPGSWPLPLPPPLARLRCLVAQGPRVASRWRHVAETLRAGAPDGRHWVLATLGVEPRMHGRGAGSALLAHWLSQVDAGAAPAYLETDAPRNLRFYERAGFRLREELRILDVPVFRMVRPAARRAR